ncbi:MAG TPA: putative Ig domain-containing protein [Candidatus Limnocylindrales bacterium]
MRLRIAFAFVILLAASLAACTPARPALTFSPSALPNATAGSAYLQTITISNNETPVGDISVSSGALPTGMTLNFVRGSSVSADLTGTPTTRGTYVFTVSAWCLGTNVSGQTGDQSYVLVVN